MVTMENTLISDSDGKSQLNERTDSLKGKKPRELAPIEKSNWLMYHFYVRKDYSVCKNISKKVYERTKGMCDFGGYMQALILRQEGKIQQSFEELQSIALLNPSNMAYLKQAAKSLYLLGKHKAAFELCSEALKHSEKDWELYYHMGICCFYMKHLEDAKNYLQQSLHLQKKDQTFLMLAKIYMIENDTNNAIDVLKCGVHFYPRDVDLASTLGLLYLCQNDCNKSFESLSTTLAHHPSDSRSLLAMGAMFQANGDFDGALSKYRIASQFCTDSAPLWNNIGMCFYGKKRFVAAISCLKRANYLCPYDWKILFNLGLVHLSMQQFASAFHFLSAAINLKQSKAQSYLLLAVALINMHDSFNAQQAYLKALQLDDKDPSILLNYIIFLAKQKNYKEAAERFHKLKANYNKFVDESRDSEFEDIILRLSSLLDNQQQVE